MASESARAKRAAISSTIVVGTYVQLRRNEDAVGTVRKQMMQRSSKSLIEFKNGSWGWFPTKLLNPIQEQTFIEASTEFDIKEVKRELTPDTSPTPTPGPPNMAMMLDQIPYYRHTRPPSSSSILSSAMAATIINNNNNNNVVNTTITTPPKTPVENTITIQDEPSMPLSLPPKIETETPATIPSSPANTETPSGFKCEALIIEETIASPPVDYPLSAIGDGDHNNNNNDQDHNHNHENSNKEDPNSEEKIKEITPILSPYEKDEVQTPNSTSAMSPIVTAMSPSNTKNSVKKKKSTITTTPTIITSPKKTELRKTSSPKLTGMANTKNTPRQQLKRERLEAKISKMKYQVKDARERAFKIMEDECTQCINLESLKLYLQYLLENERNSPTASSNNPNVDVNSPTGVSSPTSPVNTTTTTITAINNNVSIINSEEYNETAYQKFFEYLDANKSGRIAFSQFVKKIDKDGNVLKAFRNWQKTGTSRTDREEGSFEVLKS